MFQEPAKRFLNILLPARCISCGEFVEDVGSLCSGCWSDINFITKPSCDICSLPFEYDKGEDAICGNCMAERPSYDKAISVFVYNNNSSKLITHFKYGDKIHAARSFAKWMVSSARDLLPETDIITPVPLHRVRLFTRRYNQSALLANHMGEMSGVMVITDILSRTKITPPQASLPRRRRLWNVKGVFAVGKKYKEFIKGKNIILVDDVMTTGATVMECANVLKKAGAEKVFVVTLARTVGEK